MDAHEREAAGAAAGMNETYGSRIDLEAFSLPSVGDRVTYRLRGMSDTASEAGRVVRVTADSADLATLVVEAEDGSGLRVIDPRPWPTGNVLPF